MATKEHNCLVEKFRTYTELDEAEETLLNGLQVDERPIEAGNFVHTDGARSEHLYVVKSGWFASVKELVDGTRAITEVALPGDVIGLRDVTFRQHLSSLQCLSSHAVICPFTKRQLHGLFNRSVKLTEAFFAIMSREHAQLVQRLVTVARRDGVRRLAHFILETAIRLEGVRIDVRKDFNFPIDQQDLADLTGLSAVHVSRCMSELKSRSLISYSRHRMHILDRDALAELAEFDDAFLHPDIDWLRAIDAPEGDRSN
ncbi:Crp/Fnr family transcriptional regulator [Thiosocius teredinicola]|uniref:Crp/Fnr family transcriptional regulator n=1 Tax=Thiosocius teredinicola TaxID=1973002 RepID=UPI0009911157